MLCIVMRKFSGVGKDQLPGKIVDSTDWPNEAKLIGARYLAAAPAGAVVGEDGPRRYPKAKEKIR